MAKADTLPESDEICNGVASDSCHEQEGVRRLNTHLHRGSSEVEGEEVYNFNVRGGERRHRGSQRVLGFCMGQSRKKWVAVRYMSRMVKYMSWRMSF